MEAKGGIGVTDILEVAAQADAVALQASGDRTSAALNLNPLAQRVANERGPERISRIILAGSVKAIDASLIALTGLICFAAYVVPRAGFQSFYFGAFLVAAVLAILVFRSLRLYDVSTMGSFLRQSGLLLTGWIGVFAGLAMIAFFAKVGDEFSRLWLTLWFVTGAVALVGSRAVLSGSVQNWIKQGRLDRRAVIVGGGDNAASLIQSLNDADESDITIVGVFDDRRGDRSPDIVEGYPKLGTIDELIAFGRKTRIDLLIVALPMMAEKRLLELMTKLWVLPVDIRLSAHANKLKFRPRAYSFVGGVPMLDIADKPLTDWDHVVKVVFDRVVAAMMLVALSPVMLLTALAIKLDSRGPVLFKQKRYGFNNELIEVYKFRSMYTDQCDRTASKLVTKDDPRVTRVGRFIRKSSIDELPQLFNVLQGELSIVGPRPHALHAKAADRLYDQVVDGYFARHRVKPGITGWAQINGWRGETDTREKIEKRVEHDLHYIENWSLWFDIYIIAMTPVSMLFDRDNAY